MQTPVWQWQISEDEFRIWIHLFKLATHTPATIINCHKLSSLHSTPLILCSAIGQSTLAHALINFKLIIIHLTTRIFQSGRWIRGVLAVFVLHYLLAASSVILPLFRTYQQYCLYLIGHCPHCLLHWEPSWYLIVPIAIFTISNCVPD